MSSPLVFVIDDSLETLKLHEILLKKIGYEVKIFDSGDKAINEISSLKPKMVFCDMMMGDISGIDVCRDIKSLPEGKDVKVIMVSSKVYDYDRKQALQMGAEDYIIKPLTEDKIRESLKHLSTKIKFWGVRGTLPVPGDETVKYGGNTSCISVEFSKNRNFIFDAGSGIKKCSEYLMGKYKGGKMNVNLFITHPHWDHINAFPFFTPLYIPGNSINVYGPSQGDKDMYRIMSDQMDGVYFPVTIKEFGAFVKYIDLKVGETVIDGINISTMMLTHPGHCLGYKISHEGKTFCYITDNELFYPGHEAYNPKFYKELVEFVSGADYFIHDTTYFDEEYETKIGWGHSCVSQVCRLAHDAKVKKYYLFHHDPIQEDADVDRKFEEAQKVLKSLKSECICEIAHEGLEIDF